jgi:hypothetical protein
MDEPLDEQYLKWLYGQVASLRFKNPARTYWSLLRQLYAKEFVWFIPNDDNRVADGRDLRKEFFNDTQTHPDRDWMGLGCSFLEMLIALARRLSFEAEEGDTTDWFWRMLENLDLSEHSDLYYKRHTEEFVDEILERVIQRRYDSDGRGGLFPLQDPREDQRNIELWYQMSHYLLELV